MSKIAILHPHVTVKGGAVKTLLQIARHLKERGHKVTIIAFNTDRRNCFPDLNEGLDITDLQSSGIMKFFRMITLPFSLRKYDLIIAGNSPMQFVAALTKLINPRINTFWFLQNIPVYYMNSNSGLFVYFKRLLEKISLPFIDLIISNSTFIKQKIAEYYNRGSQILYPCIDTGFFSNDHQSLEENQTLFCYSRLVKGKNTELAIKTFQELQKFHPGLKLVIGGEGEEKETLQEMAQFYPEIIFTGELSPDEIKENLQKCTLFLFTSLIDAFGLTILEAMSMEKAVVALACGGAMELIGNGVNGCLAKDENEFIEYADELLRDGEKRIMMGYRGREWAIGHFSLPAMNQRIDEIISEYI